MFFYLLVQGAFIIWTQRRVCVVAGRPDHNRRIRIEPSFFDPVINNAIPDQAEKVIAQRLEKVVEIAKTLTAQPATV